MKFKEEVINGLRRCSKIGDPQQCRNCPYGSEEYCEEAVMRDALELLEKPQWIPASERQPEVNGEYLVTRGSKIYGVYLDLVKKTNVTDDMASDISAWMPAPEPFKAEEAE